MAMPLTLALPDEAATEALGCRLADVARPGDVVALHGPLGSGKTTLARAFIRRLTRPDEEVPSPTFTLVQTYPTPRGTIWHFDLFRLGGQDEAIEIGIEDAFGSGIVLIEWPERLGSLLPAGRLDLSLAVTPDGDARQAELDGAAWSRRLAEIGGG